MFSSSDGETYYNLKIEQVVRIIKYVNRNKNHDSKGGQRK